MSFPCQKSKLMHGTKLMQKDGVISKDCELYDMKIWSYTIVSHASVKQSATRSVIYQYQLQENQLLNIWFIVWWKFACNFIFRRANCTGPTLVHIIYSNVFFICGLEVIALLCILVVLSFRIYLCDTGKILVKCV